MHLLWLPRWIDRILRSGQAVTPGSRSGDRKPCLERLEDRRLLTATVLDLGTLGGYFSGAEAVNNSGQVVGQSYTANNAAIHAFLYADGQMTDLGTLPGGPYSYADAINDAGEIAGYGYTNILATHAFICQDGQMTDLGTFGGYNSSAYGINSLGQVVGDAELAGNTVYHAFMYDGTQLNDLGTFDGSGSSVATAINDAGQIVGNATSAGGGPAHAFLYSGGVMTDLGTLGGPYSQAFGVNANGLVVGTSAVMPGTRIRHAFVSDGTTMTDLGTLGGDASVALGIDSAGDIVGESTTVPGEAYPHAFLDSGGQMIDLNSLLAPDSGWTLMRASAINDNEQIVGVGAGPDGLTHAFMLNLGDGTVPHAVVPVVTGVAPTGTGGTVSMVDPLETVRGLAAPQRAGSLTTQDAQSVDLVFAAPARKVRTIAPVRIHDVSAPAADAPEAGAILSPEL